MKAYTGSRGISPPFLNPGARWRRLVNIRLRPLKPLQTALKPKGRLGGQNQSVLFGEEKNLLSPPGFELRTAHHVA